MSDIEIIPANPPTNSAGMHERRIANAATSLRDRVEERNKPLPPPAPVAELVQPEKVQRRRFEQPPVSVPDGVFRRTRQ